MTLDRPIQIEVAAGELANGLHISVDEDRNAAAGLSLGNGDFDFVFLKDGDQVHAGFRIKIVEGATGEEGYFGLRVINLDQFRNAIAQGIGGESREHTILVEAHMFTDKGKG